MFCSLTEACRTALLCRLAVWRGCIFIVESVASSVLPVFPRMQELVGIIQVLFSTVSNQSCCFAIPACIVMIAVCSHGQVFKQLVYLGAFGCRSVKPLILWSNIEDISKLARPWADAQQEVSCPNEVEL